MHRVGSADASVLGPGSKVRGPGHQTLATPPRPPLGKDAQTPQKGIDNFTPSPREIGSGKKRKVSKQIQNMRNNVDIIDLIEDDNSSMRNRIATMDMDKSRAANSDEDDLSQSQVKLKSKNIRANSKASGSNILKTPNHSTILA